MDLEKKVNWKFYHLNTALEMCSLKRAVLFSLKNHLSRLKELVLNYIAFHNGLKRSYTVFNKKRYKSRLLLNSYISEFKGYVVFLEKLINSRQP